MIVSGCGHRHGCDPDSSKPFPIVTNEEPFLTYHQFVKIFTNVCGRQCRSPAQSPAVTLSTLSWKSSTVTKSPEAPT